mmetsp:Transcript_8177/g.11388  ORF Transcript_8177/g.11388 Transcript_8177/m.11388 type:complete len:192 (-) Transcript_8177:89-664(-)
MASEKAEKVGDDVPPNPLAILVVYIVLGAILSFAFGREPDGRLPDKIILELGPTIIVICGFITSYSLYDVMAVGCAKAEVHYMQKAYKDLPAKLPEKAYLAQRVQTNQVEQLPGFIVGSLSCALLVNGTAATVLALLWAIVRRLYATTYRNAIGKPLKDMGLFRFTLPAYFISNAMLMSAVVQVVRILART